MNSVGRVLKLLAWVLILVAAFSLGACDAPTDPLQVEWTEPEPDPPIKIVVSEQADGSMPDTVYIRVGVEDLPARYALAVCVPEGCQYRNGAAYDVRVFGWELIYQTDEVELDLHVWTDTDSVTLIWRP
jgi:hypothetical protein